MKLIVLVDSTVNYDALKVLLKNKDVAFVSTNECEEESEYMCLLKHIKKFPQLTEKIMLAKFSGKDNVAKELGDKRPEMILSLSHNKNSKNYVEYPIETILDLVNIFEKETVNGITT